MLEVQGVEKRYKDQQVLKSVSLKLGQEIKVIIGVNGSGKSTLLKIIAGIEQADAGRLVLGEQDIMSLPPEERRVGYVPQHPALFTHLTIRENIEYGLRHGRGSQDFVKQIIEMLDLGAVLDKKPNECSGGYKSRTSLARALAPQPKVMLLDEPLSDIDLAIKDKLLPEFRQVLKVLNIPVLYVTHDPREAEQVGETFSLMRSGEIAHVTSADEAFNLIRNANPQVA